ncbi:MAG: RNA polymerase sporulation sigma factor SigH [Clostridia bacterium]|nr:RNA polymerase sporulation sigma factor SigH [Clostridia bacterium]MBR3196108.1 RNA polymerase sporulation sigma factor SigH [Clostridia bacterium]
MQNREYRAMTDDELVMRVREKDEQAEAEIYGRYKRLVKYCAHGFFLAGADSDDLMQEGMIGLHKAIRDFKPERDTAFHSFAELCVKRQIISAIKSATRQKHMPLNNYISLNKPVYEDDPERTLIETISTASTTDPEELFFGDERVKEIEEELRKSASKFELNVLKRYLEGSNYIEIAAELGKEPKSVDNALQRVKKKLERFLKEKNASM